MVFARELHEAHPENFDYSPVFLVLGVGYTTSDDYQPEYISYN